MKGSQSLDRAVLTRNVFQTETLPGLDVDIYFRLDLPPLPHAEREDLDLPSMVDREQRALDERFGEPQVELLRLAATDPDVARIFVNPRIKRAMCELPWQDRRFLRRLRPRFGHGDHMHVRLDCPASSADCIAQAEPPPAMVTARNSPRGSNAVGSRRGLLVSDRRPCYRCGATRYARRCVARATRAGP